MSDQDRDKWNRIYQASDRDSHGAAVVLTENLHLLPRHGKALDLACGTGANAIELAKCGLDVHAWDISDVALDRLGRQADKSGLHISLLRRDVSLHPPEPASFDVIVVARFLDRGIVPHLIEAIRPDGLLYYQTYTRDKPAHIGPSNPDYLLARNELLALFSRLAIVFYREDGRSGDLERGHRNEAMFVAQKR